MHNLAVTHFQIISERLPQHLQWVSAVFLVMSAFILFHSRHQGLANKTIILLEMSIMSVFGGKC